MDEKTKMTKQTKTDIEMLIGLMDEKLEKALYGTYDEEAIKLIYEVKDELAKMKNTFSEVAKNG